MDYIMQIAFNVREDGDVNPGMDDLSVMEIDPEE